MTINELIEIIGDLPDKGQSISFLRDTVYIHRIKTVHVRGWGAVELSDGPPCADGSVSGKACFCKDES